MDNSESCPFRIAAGTSGVGSRRSDRASPGDRLSLFVSSFVSTRFPLMCSKPLLAVSGRSASP